MAESKIERGEVNKIERAQWNKIGTWEEIKIWGEDENRIERGKDRTETEWRNKLEKENGSRI